MSKKMRIPPTKSGGVGGIENDSDSEHLLEEGENELAQLRDIMAALGR